MEGSLVCSIKYEIISHRRVGVRYNRTLLFQAELSFHFKNKFYRTLIASFGKIEKSCDIEWNHDLVFTNILMYFLVPRVANCWLWLKKGQGIIWHSVDNHLASFCIGESSAEIIFWVSIPGFCIFCSILNFEFCRILR